MVYAVLIQYICQFFNIGFALFLIQYLQYINKAFGFIGEWL